MVLGSGVVGVTEPDEIGADAVVLGLLKRLPTLQGEILGLHVRLWVVTLRSAIIVEFAPKAARKAASPIELVIVMSPSRVACVEEVPNTSIHVTLPASESPSSDE
jgi:hypothetical protein